MQKIQGYLTEEQEFRIDCQLRSQAQSLTKEQLIDALVELSRRYQISKNIWEQQHESY